MLRDLPEGFRVLFVGEAEKGEALQARASQRGVHLGVALDVQDVAGLYLLLAPDVIVLDGGVCPALAWEAHLHFFSVGAKPLVVTTEEDLADDWRQATSEDTVIVGSSQTHDELLEALASISERIPSLFTMDTHLGKAPGGPEGRVRPEIHHGG